MTTLRILPFRDSCGSGHFLPQQTHGQFSERIDRGYRSLLLPAVIDRDHRAHLDRTYRLRDAERMGRINDDMPVIGQKNPGHQCKPPLLRHPRQEKRQPREMPFLQFAARSQRSHGHEDGAVQKGRTPQPANAINLPVVRGGGNKERNWRARRARKIADPTQRGSALFALCANSSPRRDRSHCDPNVGVCAAVIEDPATSLAHQPLDENHVWYLSRPFPIALHL